MARSTSESRPSTQPRLVAVPSNSVTTTSPASPLRPTWMCAAVGSSMFRQLSRKQTRPLRGFTRMRALPRPSVSPGPGTSAEPFRFAFSSFDLPPRELFFAPTGPLTTSAPSAQSASSIPIRSRTYPPRGSFSGGRKPPTGPEFRSFGRNVRARKPAVDQERRRRHVRRVVAREEQGALRDLSRLGEAAHRDVHEAPLRLLRVLGIQLAQQRRVDRARAE